MKYFLILLIAAVLLVSACASQTPASEALTRTDGWALIEAVGQPVDAAMGAWLVFDGEQMAVSGNTGCNLLRGSYQLDAGALTIPPLAVTKRACEPGRMATEDRVLQALSEAASWQLDAGRILLFDKAGKRALIAEPRAVAEM
jgi:heat shock protein HslJ